MFLSFASCLVQNESHVLGGQGSNSPGNTPVTVPPNFGRYLLDNPIALSRENNLPANTSLERFLEVRPQFITSNSKLIGSCPIPDKNIPMCFQSKAHANASFITEEQNRWAFPTDTPSFRQVQAFGSTRDLVEKFLVWLAQGHKSGHANNYPTAHPGNLFSSENKAFWLRKNLNELGTLNVYSDCSADDNAFFNPATNEICLGKVSTVKGVYFAEDPTITWHEVGHAFNQILLNTRNLSDATPSTQDTNLGYLPYDEAGSIGEGLSDFWSFAMNARTHFAEWALGRFLDSSRPLSEDDPLHSPGISKEATERLSYPTFLNYDPNEPQVAYEDIHYAGQIISHFLTALTFDIQKNCTYTQNQAIEYTVHLIMEALGELGDQTAKGTDGASEYKINLNPSHALDWIKMVNPINYRRFIQSLGKFHLYNLGRNNTCTENVQDRFEKLADNYGLLLFRTYNADGNGLTTGHSGNPITVSPQHRIKSVLIAKEHIQLDKRDGKPQAYVLDGQSDIVNAINSLKASGQVVNISSQIDENFAYNNGNARISPGEVVGVVLNLFNNSNSTIAGLQVLGNDWDHTKNKAPCNNFSDQWPRSTQGAADLSSGEGVEGGCNYTTRTNGSDPTIEPRETLAPTCFVELRDEESTKWFSQSKLLEHLGMEPKQCLGKETSNCFIRALKGQEQAFFSKIDPQSTWAETLGGDGTPTFNFNNVIFFEISPWIPPGTRFNCRFRVRFTNCDDCWHDPSSNTQDDYLDFEYSGARPFQIVNFSFLVID